MANLYGGSPSNAFEVRVTALDPGYGYLLEGVILIADTPTVIREHYLLRTEVASRLATGWGVFASAVDSEPQ